MKRKSVFKSMSMLALSLALMLFLAVTASAASITIKGGTQAGMGGAARFTAYQIFKGNVGGADKAEELVGITWGSGVDSDKLVTALKESSLPVNADGGSGTFGEKFTAAWDTWKKEYEDSVGEAELVAQFLAQHLTDKEYADDFARIVAGCTKETGTASKLTGDGTGWVIDLPEAGYYLVKDTYATPAGDGTKPDSAVSSYILQVSGNASVAIKSSIPTVEKKVEGKDGHLAGTDQEVTFTLTGTVAENISEYETYSYTFTDTLSKGLTLSEAELAALEVKVVNGESSSVIAEAGNYTASVTDGTKEGEHILTVAFTDLKKAAGAALNKGSKIIVTYKAKLNGDVIVGNGGNTNDVTLKYSNNPYSGGTGESVTDEVKTYTLGLDIVKQNAEREALKDAKFKLQNAANQYAKLEAKAGTEGIVEYYTIIGWDSNGTEFVTDKNGKIHIHGLSTGTFTLVETEAPKDYEKMKDIKFIIAGGTEATDISLGEVSLTLDADHAHREDVQLTKDMDAATGTATLTLTNYKAPILPHTGGIGAKIVYVVSGLAVLIGVCVVLAAFRKRKDDPQK